MITKILSFAEILGRFDLKPAKAIEYFQQKGLRETFDWRDMLGEEHNGAFTVAKMMDMDLLSTVQERLQRALDDGSTFETFARELIPQLQKSGWWGKKDVVDPLTGQVIEAQLGSASRLEQIFRSNLQSAYSVGRWDMIQRNAKYAPYLMYDAVDDHRTRDEHSKWDETVLPVSNAFWFEFFPPNGYNCRCGTIQMSQADLNDYGLKLSPPPKVARRKWENPRTGKTEVIPEDITPGWNKNPGKARLSSLVDTKEQKRKKLPPEQAQAVTKTPEPELPDIGPELNYSHDEMKQRGGDQLTSLFDERMSDALYEGQSRLEVLNHLVDGNLDDPRLVDWAEDFQQSLLVRLEQVRPISTPAAIEGRGKGVTAVKEASKRYPDDWTKATDEVGPLYVKYSTSRGFEVSIDQDFTGKIPILGRPSAKKREFWPKGTGFILTDESSTAAHEYAHRIQFALKGLDDYFNEEHRRRTAGDPLKRMRDLTGMNYDRREVTREDGYYHPYMGKEYTIDKERPAMEVMTMAFEPLLGTMSQKNALNLSKLLSVDPDMAQLAIGLLFYYRVSER
ncbi:phage head morphogenesis protein [Gilvimarinus sp. 1_MG-2023]|uniref:phage head morphogenesis protein n=1 Tax=Gilvimarinus sp. 1_MG-2023 TaxID=3062638 RepID=UPI0026E46BA0|nr:phage minor head protein [Gilvimarinus sp. 1_MG-2023]MDO6747192.1 phage minor head protein [Gilvimarinus sp. 1_MG-2023]